MIGDHSQHHLLLFGCTKHFQAFRIVASAGRALWGNSVFFWLTMSKDEGGVPKNILLNLRKLYIQKFSGGPSFTAQQVWQCNPSFCTASGLCVFPIVHINAPNRSVSTAIGIIRAIRQPPTSIQGLVTPLTIPGLMPCMKSQKARQKHHRESYCTSKTSKLAVSQSADTKTKGFLQSDRVHRILGYLVFEKQPNLPETESLLCLARDNSRPNSDGPKTVVGWFMKIAPFHNEIIFWECGTGMLFSNILAMRKTKHSHKPPYL